MRGVGRGRFEGNIEFSLRSRVEFSFVILINVLGSVNSVHISRHSF